MLRIAFAAACAAWIALATSANAQSKFDLTPELQAKYVEIDGTYTVQTDYGTKSRVFEVEVTRLSNDVHPRCHLRQISGPPIPRLNQMPADGMLVLNGPAQQLEGLNGTSVRTNVKLISLEKNTPRIIFCEWQKDAGSERAVIMLLEAGPDLQGRPYEIKGALFNINHEVLDITRQRFSSTPRDKVVDWRKGPRQ